MRVPALLAAALVLAACGPKAPETAEPAPPAAAAPTMGNTAMTPNHTIQMIDSKFEPVDLKIKAGDVVEFKNVSGGVHNVVFDNIPAGAYAAIAAGISDKADSVSTSMINEGSSVMVSFKDAPAGVYHFTCMPHMANGMKGTITVEP